MNWKGWQDWSSCLSRLMGKEVLEGQNMHLLQIRGFQLVLNL